MVSLSLEEKEALLNIELWERKKLSKWDKITILFTIYSIIEYLLLKA